MVVIWSSGRHTSRVVGRQGVTVVSLAPEMLRYRRVEGQVQPCGMEM